MNTLDRYALAVSIVAIDVAPLVENEPRHRQVRDPRTAGDQHLMRRFAGTVHDDRISIGDEPHARAIAKYSVREQVTTRAEVQGAAAVCRQVVQGGLDPGAVVRYTVSAGAEIAHVVAFREYGVIAMREIGNGEQGSRSEAQHLAACQHEESPLSGSFVAIAEATVHE
jgi:hypothetical protein